MFHFVILIDTLSGGGAEKVMLRLAKAMREKNYYVTFIVINPVVSHEIPEDIDIIFLRHNNGRGFKLTYYWRTASVLQRLLDEISAKRSIQAVISNLPETDRVSRYLKGYRVCYCVHSLLHRSLVNPKVGWKKLVRERRLKKIYDKKHIIFVSEGARQEIVEKMNINLAGSKVIYNPFPLEEIREKSLGLMPAWSDYLICVGRFNSVKRHDKLLNIYAKSGLKNPLVLMGEGDDEKVKLEIEFLVQKYKLQDQVFITGFKTNPFPYIRNALALLLTSDYEGLPTVIIEALICGTPVVAYDCPSGPREILTGELKEFLIPFDDEQAFIQKMQQLVSQPRRISEKVAQLQRFDAGTIAQQYIDWLVSIK